jgi:hypothetical protein
MFRCEYLIHESGSVVQCPQRADLSRWCSEHSRRFRGDDGKEQWNPLMSYAGYDTTSAAVSSASAAIPRASMSAAQQLQVRLHLNALPSSLE